MKTFDDSDFCGGRLWPWVVCAVATWLEGGVGWSFFGQWRPVRLVVVTAG